MRLLKLILILSSLMVMTAEAGTPWKLQHLAQVSNALLVEQDQAGQKNGLSCGLNASEVSAASQKLQGLIDGRLVGLKGKKDQVQKLRNTCAKDCTCDIYDYALEKLDSEVVKSPTSVVLTMDQRKVCRSQLKNFCQSEIFKFLKK